MAKKVYRPPDTKLAGRVGAPRPERTIAFVGNRMIISSTEPGPVDSSAHLDRHRVSTGRSGPITQLPGAVIPPTPNRSIRLPGKRVASSSGHSGPRRINQRIPGNNLRRCGMNRHVNGIYGQLPELVGAPGPARAIGLNTQCVVIGNGYGNIRTESVVLNSNRRQLRCTCSITIAELTGSIAPPGPQGPIRLKGQCAGCSGSHSDPVTAAANPHRSRR